MGNVKIVSINYRQFTSQMRKRIPGLDCRTIYREWNRVLNRTGDTPMSEIYDRIAKRLNKKKGLP
jgi:hypothetical protein